MTEHPAEAETGTGHAVVMGAGMAGLAALGEELGRGGAVFADSDRSRLGLNGHRLAPLQER